MRLNLELNSPIACAGQPFDGVIRLMVDNANDFPTQLYVQLKGFSMTQCHSSGSGGTYIEIHIHVNMRIGLYDATQIEGTASSSAPLTNSSKKKQNLHLSAHAVSSLKVGLNEIPFSILVPTHSACPYSLFEDGHKRYQRCGHARAVETTRGMTTMPLPPRTPKSTRFSIKYSIRAVAVRDGIFRRNKTSRSGIQLVPATVIRSSVLLSQPVVQDIRENRTVLSARCNKLPKSYFVTGALPKASNLRQLMALGSKDQMMVGVPIRAKLGYENHAKVTLDIPFSIDLWIGVDVDNYNKIDGILDISVLSVKIMVIATTTGSAGPAVAIPEVRHITVATIDNDSNSGRLKLTRILESEVPMFKVESTELCSLLLKTGDTIPSFVIRSMRTSHSLRAEIMLSLNGSGSKRVAVWREITVATENLFDMDEQMVLPPAYEGPAPSYQETDVQQQDDDDSDSDWDKDDSDWDSDEKVDNFG
ncbi:uncharacterized protein V1516DRAFT_664135 [Lipomyces oligophaga]|uniref:uncharacterized protein n=1 Tax=Lipomyces oligophaga TaxID=45792 RepID=UPI0034CDBF6D